MDLFILFITNALDTHKVNRYIFPMKTGTLLVLSGIALLSCETHDRDFERILTLEMNRSSCDSLTFFLRASEPRVRKRALQAIGRIGSPDCVDEVAVCLEDLNHTVRAAAAFTLGQLGDPGAEPVLIQNLYKDSNPDSRKRLVEALGRIGTTASIVALRQSMRDPKVSIRAEAALALGRLQSRGVADSLDQFIVPALFDVDANVRWRACYALQAADAGTKHRMDLLQALGDPDARVRIFAIRAFTDSSDYTILEPMAKALNSDADWRVRVEAAKALGMLPLNLTASSLTLQEQIPNVRIAILRAIGKSASIADHVYRSNNRESNIAKYQIEMVLKDSRTLSPAELGTALIAYARLLGSDATEPILAFSQYPAEEVRRDVVYALEATGSRALFNILLKLYPEASPRTKIAILQTAKSQEERRSAQLLFDGLKEDDAVLVAMAADGLSADSLNAGKHFDRIVEAYQRIRPGFDVETAEMVFNALSSIDSLRTVEFLRNEPPKSPIRTSYAASKLLALTSPDSISAPHRRRFREYAAVKYAEISKLQNATALIRTRYGDIRIRLRPNEAPITVLNFVRLAEKGFYDGLTFHRVEPNFVVQAGDPRGDSWGSPGYSIPSEYNPISYMRGTVGMASAGKDTEGSQFFITYSPQPHLDGRYTVFGQVEQGIEIVDVLKEGDVMELVAISR
jgi:cyclophilin family peptidyl-prolyl cis-trans isomerase/HEAT repeat protein